VTLCEILSCFLPCMTEEEHKELIRIAGFWVRTLSVANKWHAA